VWLGVTLLWPPIGDLLAPLTFGRWVPLHLDWQLYGWCALPLVGALIAWCFDARHPGAGRHAHLALGAWSLALLLGAVGWLGGTVSGKLFLDWHGWTRPLLPAAMHVLWALLAAHTWWRWREMSRGHRILRGAVLAGLLVVPSALYWAADRGGHPPVNPDSGGATGASLLGSTLGIVKAVHASDAVGAYRHAAQYDDVVLAEQFISGRELTVAILGGGDSARALPLIEIVAPDGNYDYQNKYFSDDTRYLCPAPIEPALAAHIAQISVQAYRVLGCEGWGRADVILDAAGKAWLIEMNTSPGMTGHSLVPMAAKAVGMDYPSLCMHILSEARCKVGRLKQE
jgi:hypothetical protein